MFRTSLKVTCSLPPPEVKFPWKFPETCFLSRGQISKRISRNLDLSQGPSPAPIVPAARPFGTDLATVTAAARDTSPAATTPASETPTRSPSTPALNYKPQVNGPRKSSSKGLRGVSSRGWGGFPIRYVSCCIVMYLACIPHVSSCRIHVSPVSEAPERARRAPDARRGYGGCFGETWGFLSFLV